jgi:tRNA(Ile)-lysidine synthase
VHRFVRNLITEWRGLGLPFKGGSIVVAVSGGADSMSLLLALDDLRKRKKLDLRIVAAHFDHKLRPDSRSDFEFVAGFSKERGFELIHGEWHRQPGGNLEQGARNARYEFLSNSARKLKAGYVITAHTMNDQAETFLINLIRGSGTAGLGGIKPIREFNFDSLDATTSMGDPRLPFQETAVILGRPLINWAKRRDTENFCLENEVDFRRDPMNEDLNFRRVWVRKVLIPMLQEANPKIVETLCQTAEMLRSGPPLEANSADSVRQKLPETGNLDLKHLKTLDTSHLYPVLRDWIKLHRGNIRGIGHKHVEAIDRLIHSPKSGRIAELPGGAVVKQGGRLSWRPGKGEKG